MPNSGSVPLGANTVPDNVVGGLPIALQSTTWHCRPTHASGLPGPPSSPTPSSPVCLPPQAINGTAKQTAATIERIGASAGGFYRTRYLVGSACGPHYCS